MPQDRCNHGAGAGPAHAAPDRRQQGPARPRSHSPGPDPQPPSHRVRRRHRSRRSHVARAHAPGQRMTPERVSHVQGYRTYECARPNAPCQKVGVSPEKVHHPKCAIQMRHSGKGDPTRRKSLRQGTASRHGIEAHSADRRYIVADTPVDNALLSMRLPSSRQPHRNGSPRSALLGGEPRADPFFDVSPMKNVAWRKRGLTKTGLGE